MFNMGGRRVSAAKLEGEPRNVLDALADTDNSPGVKKWEGEKKGAVEGAGERDVRFAVVLTPCLELREAGEGVDGGTRSGLRQGGRMTVNGPNGNDRALAVHSKLRLTTYVGRAQAVFGRGQGHKWSGQVQPRVPLHGFHRPVFPRPWSTNCSIHGACALSVHLVGWG